MKIKALKVCVGERPYVVEVDNGLEALQKEVGGYIEVMYPWNREIAIICNAEGKIMGLPLNRPIYTDNGELLDIIAGDFLVTGIGTEDFRSIKKADAIYAYNKLYFPLYYPEFAE